MPASVRFQRASILLLTVLGVAVGCARKPDDAKITRAIQASFSGDSGLQGKQLGVQAENGAVTITGTVDNQAERDAAARYAAAVPGVRQVVNNLQISGAAPLAETAQVEQPAVPPARVRAQKPSPARRRRHTMSASGDDDSAVPPATPGPEAQDQHDQPPPAQPTAMTAPPPPPPAPPPPPQKATIPSGTVLAIRLVDAIDSDSSQQGQTFHATLDSPLAVDGNPVVPAGYEVEGHVVDVKSAGKFAGRSELTLQLDRISVSGKYYDIQTNTYHREANSRGKDTAEKVGAGTVIGAVLGGILGGGKGAAVGAAAGGGVGGGVQASTKSQQIKLPSETVLNFTLQSPVTVVPTTKGPDTGRRRLDTPQ
jgi:hypothetical protein